MGQYMDLLTGGDAPAAPEAKPTGGDYMRLLLGDAAPEPDIEGVRGHAMRATGPNPGLMETVNRTVNAIGTAGTKGFTNLLGMARDLPEMASAGGRMAGQALGDALGLPELPADKTPRSYIPDFWSFLPGSRDLRSLVFDRMGVPEVNAESRAGKLGQAAVEGATSSPFGPLGFLYGALSGTGSEAAGQTAQALGAGPKVEGAARVAGGVLAPVPAMLYSGIRSTPARIANDALDGVTPQQLNAAQQLMDDAAARGIPLSAPEALAQVTGGNMLQDTQRYVEASRRGGPIMRDFYNRRPGQNEAAMATELRNIGPDDLQPGKVVEQVSGAARGTIQGARSARTAASRPHYEAAAGLPADVNDVQPILTEIERVLPRVGVESAAGRSLKNLWERAANAQTVGELDTIYKEFRDRLSALPMAPNAMQAAEKGVVGPVVEQLGTRIRQISPEIDQGRSLYEFNSQRVNDLRRPEVLGGLQKAVAETGSVPAGLDRQVRTVLDPKAMRPENIRRIAGELRMKDPEAFGNLMRTHLENTFNEATGRLVGGENQWGAAKFAKELTGNQQSAANLQAAIESLPNGRQSWNGLRRLLDVFEAQGKRLPPNSSTAGNLVQQQAQSEGGLLRAVTRSPLKTMSDWYDQFRLGMNSRQLATWMTDPRGVELLRQAAMVGPDSARATAIAVELMAIGRPAQDQ
jgi:general stress protein YciG